MDRYNMSPEYTDTFDTRELANAIAEANAAKAAETQAERDAGVWNFFKLIGFVAVGFVLLGIVGSFC